MSTVVDEDEMDLDNDESPLCPPFPVIMASDRDIKPLRRCKAKDHRSIPASSPGEQDPSNTLAVTEAWQSVNISHFANILPD